VLGIVLHKIDGLDNVRVVQCRGDAELCSELLDVFLLCLILATFPKLLLMGVSIIQPRGKKAHLDRVQFLLTPIPLVCKPNNTSRALTDRQLLTYAILLC